MKVIAEASMIRATFWGEHSVIGVEEAPNHTARWYIRRNDKRIYQSSWISRSAAIERFEARVHES